jgi:SAM-dependent methyltransferase
MPSSVQEHYDNLLAEHYDWMFGVPLESKVAEQKILLQELLGAEASGVAVDLGCGSGFQTVALADLGYEVLAIDLSARLLGDLRGRVGSRQITVKHADMLALDSLVAAASADVVVCMGDTLTHLSSRHEVARLFQSVYRALKPGGRFIVTYRDLANGELVGVDRFIAVRSDDQRVMTCFLEYTTPDTVVVHDLINIREADGQWALQKSSYTKLRLPVEWASEEMGAAGMEVTDQRLGRLLTLAARKPGGA